MKWRAVRVGVLFAAVAAGSGVPLPSMPQSGSSCPLPLDQQLDSVKAFEPIARFVTSEPRCFNCHGGVNPHIDGVGRDPGDPNAPVSTVEHGGGAQDRGEKGLMAEGCQNCHENMVPKRDGTPSKWFNAPGFRSFVGKDAATLCKQFKRATGTAEHFIGHITDDNGGDNFSQTAFSGNRGLNEEWYTKGSPPAKPSMSHSEFKRLANDWIKAMGGEFKGDESCGCVPQMELTIEHHLADRLDTMKYRGGFAVFKSDVRFDARLASKDGKTADSFVAQVQVPRSYAVGHVTPRCAPTTIDGTEIWFIEATLDPDTEMLELDLELGSNSRWEGIWVCDGEPGDAGVDIFSNFPDHGPYKVPAKSGSSQRFVIPQFDGIDEFLTVTVK